MLKNCGVEYNMQSEEIKSKIDWFAAKIKQHETKKLNGTYGKSKIEDEFYIVLCNVFGIENIERQKLVNGWAIDFYLKLLDLHIQFDGRYYHGLDRPIEEIKLFKTKSDTKVFETYIRDKNQDIYFAQHNLKLLRVTDKEFKQLGHSVIEKITNHSNLYLLPNL